jgi:amino acid adenylation domain-containing protein
MKAHFNNSLGSLGTIPLRDIIAGFACLTHKYTGDSDVKLAVNDEPVLISFEGNPAFKSIADQIAITHPDGHPIRITASDLCLEGEGRLEPGALHLELRLNQDDSLLSFSFDEATANSEAVSCFAEQLARLLTAQSESPALQVSKAPILTAEERTALLRRWEGPNREHSPFCITEIFEKTACDRANNVALIEGAQRQTYQELNNRANQTARLLRDIGVIHETRVGCYLEPSIEAVVAILAILKAGGTYVPIEATAPRERLADICLAAGLSLVVTDPESTSKLPPGIRALSLQEEKIRIDAQATTDFPSGCTPDSAAYVLYTSGSTGKPQGVIGIHRGITNGMAESQFDSDRPDEVCCLNAPLSTAFSLLILYLPLLLGVPLVILTSSQIKDPIRLADAIAAYGVTTIGISTPALRSWLAMGTRIASSLRKLRSVMVGGAPLTPDLAAAFARILPWATLENGYGGTELGSIATRGVVSSGSIMIGRPITNTRVYLLDKYREPVPFGAVGEIYVSSAHLAKGYLDQPDLTASRFFPDLLESDKSVRMYQTGDLGRATSGGIQFLGRADDQVKIRGFRVYLNEVEAVLAGCSGVGSVAVASKSFDGEERLVAYIVRDFKEKVDESQIRGYVRNRLPEYMVPTSIVWLESLPVTEGGKLDRVALPGPLVAPQTGQDSPDDVSLFLMKTWQTILGIDDITVNDHFLDLGGDSLFAVRVTARLDERYGLQLTLEDFFDHPTIAALATLVRCRTLAAAQPARA